MALWAPMLLLVLSPLVGQQRDIAILGSDGTPQPGEKWALLIGCNGYDPNEVGALKVAVADATRLRDTLVTTAGFESGHVLLFTDEGLSSGTASRTDVRPVYTQLRGEIAKFTDAHQAGDVLFLFFAGHGFHSEATGKDYLAPLDVHRADLEHTGVPVDDVLQQLKASGARQAVLVVDACRNLVGRAVAGQTEGVGDASLKSAEAMGVWYLASCRPGQISQEDPGLGGGVYSHYLAEAMSGAADGYAGAPEDSYVTVTEAQAYAAAKVEEWSRVSGGQVQTPCRSEYDVTGGEMVLSVPGVYEAPPAPRPPVGGGPAGPAPQPAVPQTETAAQTVAAPAEDPRAARARAIAEASPSRLYALSTNTITAPTRSYVQSLFWSSDTTVAYATDKGIWVEVDVETGNTETLTSAPSAADGNVMVPRDSSLWKLGALAKGHRVSMALAHPRTAKVLACSDKDNDDRVVITDATGSEATQPLVPRDKGFIVHLAWSPDGTRFAAMAMQKRLMSWPTYRVFVVEVGVR